jgi:hypothetical protein
VTRRNLTLTPLINKLNTTGVPFPVECLYACEVEDRKLVENSLHKAFYPYRVNPRREFFEIDPEQAIVILRLFSKKDVTPVFTAEIDKSVSAADQEASENYKKKRPPLNFIQMGIPIGVPNAAFSATFHPLSLQLTSFGLVQFSAALRLGLNDKSARALWFPAR